MSTPRVSTIINVRNGSATLRQAMNSVLAQSFSDWELIVWDDGSTDDSAAIVEREPDRRVRYFLSPHSTTLGSARNQAMRQARGEWLAFLDQDDVWLPDKLEKQLALCEADPDVGIVYGRTLLYTRNGQERDFDHRHEFQPLPEGDIFEKLFVDSCFISMSSSLLRRSAVEAIGDIPEFIEITPDYYLFVAVAKQHRARAVQGVVCRYLLHLGGMSHWSGPRMHREAIWIVDHWAAALPAELVSWRHRVHTTVWAFEEMRRLNTFVPGLKRLVRDGSPGYLFSRPFARGYRALRRRIQRPFWKSIHDDHRDAETADGTQDRIPSCSSATHPLIVSILIVNWNVADLLRNCLRSLFDSTRLPTGSWEIIVVDNDSSDGSVEMLRKEFPSVLLLVNSENVGFARANNQAFELSRGKYVLLLNPDTLIEDDAVDRLVRMMNEQERAAAIGCSLQNPDRSFQRWTGGNAPNLGNIVCHFLLMYKVLPASVLPPPLYLEQEPSHDRDVGWVSGACMLLRRDPLGPRIFDERFFMYGEDLDLCDRLRRKGWRIIYTPRTHIVHLDGRSMAAQSPETQVTKLRSLREVFRMRHGRSSLVIYDCVVALGFLIRSTLFGISALVRPSEENRSRSSQSSLFLRESLRSLLAGEVHHQ